MKTLLILIFSLAACTSAVGQSKVAVYANVAYRYSVEYPAELYAVDPRSMETNGVKFTSPTPYAKMMAWARPTSKPDIAGEYEIFLKSYGKVVKEKLLAEDHFLIKGSDERRSFQVKAFVREWKGVRTIYTLSVDYPKDDEKFKSAAETIIASFKLIESETK